MVDAERFISLILKERFDYTDWQKDLFSGVNVRELSSIAMENREESGIREPDSLLFIYKSYFSPCIIHKPFFKLIGRKLTISVFGEFLS